MRIEIWSDIVCPWCYIGKRRLETALAGFPHEVEVVWRSFQLDPGSPVQATETVAEHLGRKYGGGREAGQRMIDNVEAVAAEEGLVYRLGEAKRVNTVDAHRLLHLAQSQGVQAELEEALFSAYFTQAADVGDHEVLRRLGVEVGLEPDRVDATLDSDEFRDAVYADIEQAQAYGATGVPFFVIDAKYGISGAQPADVFTQVLEQAWADSHPTLQMTPSSGEGACGPDGCAV
ncbi:DsbA family oxidoreductase [Nocardioides sp.]|uniref:DsbA family oxidoreductase n=1 Tax=Nocardioides sp. TaxID=35761 RepID=UPI003D0A663E